MPKKPLLLVNLELSPPCKENYFYYLFRFSTCDEGSTHNNTLKIPLLFCKNMLTMIIMKGLGQQCLDWHFGCFSVCGQKWLVFACDTIIKKMTVLYFLYLVCFGYVKTDWMLYYLSLFLPLRWPKTVFTERELCQCFSFECEVYPKREVPFEYTDQFILQQLPQKSTMLMLCLVSFFFEANEITLCKLHISS